MNELITRSLTGAVFIFIVVFATTFHLISASILWAVVLGLGLKEYRKLKGAPIGYLLITVAVMSLWGMGFVAWIGSVPYYNGLDVVAFLTWIWANDTFAYLGGKMFGKKFIQSGLAPKVSPNKSWEGAFVGAVGATFVGWLWMGNDGAWLGVLTGILSTLGDLVQSALKRHANVKDSGSLLPGHGGILDRFDGLLIAAPVLLIIRLFIL